MQTQAVVPTDSAPISLNKNWLFLIFAAIVLGTLFPIFYERTIPCERDNLLKMEKGGGKNANHANQKARQSAEQEYQKVKQEYEALDKKRMKTPDDKKLLDKLEKQMKHWKKKKDWGGEHHSQKPKK